MSSLSSAKAVLRQHKWTEEEKARLNDEYVRMSDILKTEATA
jgi:hypothetical protein